MTTVTGCRTRSRAEWGGTLDLYLVDQWLDTQTTSDAGGYHFIDLTPGDYVVDVTDANGALADYALTTDSAPLRISPGEGEHYDGANFGYEAVARPAEPTAIVLTSLAGDSGARASVTWQWVGLVGLTGLTIGGLIRRQRQRP
jgi:hypothetical protein